MVPGVRAVAVEDDAVRGSDANEAPTPPRVLARQSLDDDAVRLLAFLLPAPLVFLFLLWYTKAS